MAWIITAFILLLFLVISYFDNRNKKLGVIISDITELTHTLADKELKLGNPDWQKQYDYINSLPYSKMLFSFWIPVNSYYEDFIKRIGG